MFELARAFLAGCARAHGLQQLYRGAAEGMRDGRALVAGVIARWLEAHNAVPAGSRQRAFADVLRDAGLVNAAGRVIGSPNSLRHTIIAEMHRSGMPEAG